MKYAYTLIKSGFAFYSNAHVKLFMKYKPNTDLSMADSQAVKYQMSTFMRFSYKMRKEILF